MVTPSLGRIVAMLGACSCTVALSAETRTRFATLKKERIPAAVTTRAVAFATAAGFATVAADVFVGKRLMPNLDEAAQRWAGDEAKYDSVTGRALSNIAPSLLVATAASCAATPPKDRRRALAVAGTWTFVNPVVFGLKELFHRDRPDPVHHREFSFPSGHTANAAFLSACLFTILLPPLRRPKLDESNATPPIFIAIATICTASVAAGRVLTEAHFLSDTLAGACLGLFFANLAARLSRPPPPRLP